MQHAFPGRVRRALLVSVSAAATLLLPAATAAAAASPVAPAVRAEEYWTAKQGIKLWIYRKQLAAPGTARPVLFLVHGSSYSAKTMFDLQVPDRENYSMMDYFARLGFDVWTMDHEGYGHSDRSAGLSGIASGVDDLALAMAVVKRVTGQTKAAFFGQSSGSLRAGAFANAFPDQVTSLVLDAFVWTGEGSPTLEKRKLQLPALRKSNVRKVDAAFYSGVFTRDEAGAAEPMISALVTDAERKYGNTVPNGTYIDMTTQLPLVDPLKLHCPVLILRGQHDGIATDADIIAFYSRLPHPDKQLVKIGGMAHTAMLGVNRGRFLAAMQAFLTMPPAIDIGARAK
ncbi:alpha/beta hydrolase [Massilia sp. S19_KUP03_FR1]|uniref:alpha/beta hydrolase n=1 Tax=Massilia sp. S19_KUP03_FR1 TaxID=3025503 RepID=UPI002FCDC49A